MPPCTILSIAQQKDSQIAQAAAPNRMPDFRSMLEAALRGDMPPTLPPGSPPGGGGGQYTSRSTRSLGGFSELWSASEVRESRNSALCTLVSCCLTDAQEEASKCMLWSASEVQAPNTVSARIRARLFARQRAPTPCDTWRMCQRTPELTCKRD